MDVTIAGPDGGPLEWVTGFVLSALGRGERADAVALRFLLGRYCATGRDDLRDALEPALARASEDQLTAETSDQCAEWLTLFAEAVAVSGDERLRTAATDLLDALRKDWGYTTSVAAGVASVDACLGASHLVDPRTLVPQAIDELERFVTSAYRPGEGLARLVNEPAGPRGRLLDHVRTSAALLTAFGITGRLPYAMLAEELMQVARRTLWDEAAGGFFESSDSRRKPFALNCDASRVLCRIAALHRDNDYRAAAVLAPDSDYAHDVARILIAHAETYREHGLASASYGLALEEWMRGQSSI